MAGIADDPLIGLLIVGTTDGFAEVNVGVVIAARLTQHQRLRPHDSCQ